MKYTLSMLVFAASVAAAHPGHDHASWSAPFLHALWGLPVAAALIAATYVAVKKLKKHKNK